MKKLLLVIGLTVLVMKNMQAIELFKYVKRCIPNTFFEMLNSERKKDVFVRMKVYCDDLKLSVLENDPKAIEDLRALKSSLFRNKRAFKLSLIGLIFSFFGVRIVYEKVLDKTKRNLFYMGAGITILGLVAMLIHSGYNIDLLNSALK